MTWKSPRRSEVAVSHAASPRRIRSEAELWPIICTSSSSCRFHVWSTALTPANRFPQAGFFRLSGAHPQVRCRDGVCVYIRSALSSDCFILFFACRFTLTNVSTFQPLCETRDLLFFASSATRITISLRNMLLIR